MKRKISAVDPAVADRLIAYEWPGNVRELENAMERAVALARGARVVLEDLPEEVRQAVPRPVPTASGTVPSPRRHREGLHPRSARSERRKPNPYRRAAEDRACNALSQAEELRPHPQRAGEEGAFPLVVVSPA